MGERNWCVCRTLSDEQWRRWRRIVSVCRDDGSSSSIALSQKNRVAARWTYFLGLSRRIVVLVGKHGRVRTVPVPTWTKVAIDAWTSAAGLVEGYLFRPVSRADRPLLAGGDPLSRIESLMAARQAVYAQADASVSTVDASIEEAAAGAIRAWRDFGGERRLKEDGA